MNERKKAEEELIRLSNAVKMSTDSIVISDIDGKIIDVNEATLKMYGADNKRHLIGKNSFDLIAPEDRERAFAGMEDVLEKGYLKSREYNIITKDGGRIPVEMSAAIMKDADGKPIGFVGISRDITERKQAEAALRESEEKLRVMFESINDGVAIVDLGGNVVEANEAHLRMFGYSHKEELVGQNAFGSIAEKDRARAMEGMRKLFEEESSVPTEYTLRDKDGREFYAELSATLLRDSSGNPVGVVSVTRDITERKQMQEKLEEYSQRLEELVEKRTRQLKEAQEQLVKSERLAAIGELATMVGHDLRNPLQAIENATYYLNNELPRLLPSILISQKAVEMLQIINTSVNYADKVIKDLHDFSATKKPVLKKTNINDIVKDVLSQVETPENVELTTELSHLPKIKADKDMIKRAFLNLTINAIQAMENGGNLKVSTKKTRDMIEVSFKDTGAGMSKEKMKKIFTPFFTTRAQGMGMGLPVCKKFVEIHGGSITVESKEGKGSTFTVKLPIQ